MDTKVLLDSIEETKILVNTSSYPKLATLSVPGYSTIDIGLQGIKEPTSDNPEYTYLTQPFYLVATDSGETANTVSIKLQSNDGTSITNKITIKYSKK